MSIRISKSWAHFLMIVLISALNANAQFSSGSTGADGALDYSNLPTPSTVMFDPAKFTAAPHPPGQNTFNFTTINVPSGITVILSSQTLNGPVFWLATGDVTISGTIQLSGQPGHPATTDTSLRIPALSGPGGYPGGIGGKQGNPPQAGYGPGGGAAGIGSCCPIDPVTSGFGGSFTGNSVLAPPIGGSGGGGSFCLDGTNFGPGGGGGGGALVIASSTTITVNGVIDARGGTVTGGCNFNGGINGGGGAGGSIELAANSVRGGGSALAGGGCCGFKGSINGSSGSIRFESVQLPVNINTDIQASQAAPGALFQPNLPVSIQVTNVGGVQVASPALGRFQNPDVVINSSAPVTVTIQTTGIPPGTVLNLNVYAEDGSVQTAQTTALQGTLQSATATANVTFPPDLSLGYVKATWTTQ